jgi:tetratricopeptide (TPR) repeat protein
LDALDTLIEAGLVVEPRLKGQAEFSLAHECYGEIAYDTLPALRRRRLHRQVAQALRAALDHDPALYPRLAYHYRQGGQLPEATQFAIRAGESALQLYDCPRAAGHFQEALAWALEGGVTLAEAELATLHFKWGEALRRCGQYAAALSQYEHALPLAHGELKQNLAYQVCAVRAMRGEDGLSDFRRLMPLLERELNEAGETWALLSLRCEQAYVLALQGEPQVARRYAAAGWRVARHLAPNRPDNVCQMAEATNKLARCHELWADWRLALRHAQRTLDLCSTHDDLTGTSASHLILGAAYHGLGEWNLALDHLERAYRLAAAAGDLRTQAEILYRSGQLYLERGDWAGVEEAVHRILAAAEASGDRLRHAFGQSLAARLGMRRGSPQPAIATLQHHEQMAVHAGVLSYAAQARRYLAEAYLLAGQLEAALTTAEQGLALARQCGLKREAGGLLRIKGVAGGRLAGCAQAERTLLQAVELARGIHCPYDTAEATRDLGQLYLENGRDPEGQARLEAALALFQELGAVPDAGRVRQVRSGVAAPAGTAASGD